MRTPVARRSASLLLFVLCLPLLATPLHATEAIRASLALSVSSEPTPADLALRRDAFDIPECVVPTADRPGSPPGAGLESKAGPNGAYGAGYDSALVHNARVRGRTYRKALKKRSNASFNRMGQMTYKEFQWMRQFAKRIGKDIVMTGSLTETRIGMRNRLDPAVRHLLPEFRQRKPWSSLLDPKVGADGKFEMPDLDFWEGSGLTRPEFDVIEQRFYGWKADHTGYSLAEDYYPKLSNFHTLPKGEPGPGAIIFRSNGSVERILGGWQRGRLK
jgi:hypothetical protein